MTCSSCMLEKYHQLKPRVWNLRLNNLNTKAERISKVVVQELESKILHTQTSHFNQTYLKITSRFLFLTASNSTVISETLWSRFFSARKHGFVEAGVRNTSTDRTAFIFLPGGIGTLDEIFEILTLFQLNRIGSACPVPVLLLNYDNFYTNLLSFLSSSQEWGTLSAGEFEAFCQVCTSNSEALKYLADFYSISK